MFALMLSSIAGVALGGSNGSLMALAKVIDVRAVYAWRRAGRWCSLAGVRCKDRMMPHVYELPSAIGLILGGPLAGFAGYRLFRIVLGIYGFILGAMIGLVMGTSSGPLVVVAAVVGGLLGAVALMFASIAGVALGISSGPLVVVVLPVAGGPLGAVTLMRVPIAGIARGVRSGPRVVLAAVIVRLGAVAVRFASIADIPLAHGALVAPGGTCR